MLLKVDGFDNNFIGWGCEDLDFGYRLYKNGCNFIKQNVIRSVHQEHPINYIDRGQENIFYFTKKYESIDLLLFYYGYLISVDKAIANNIMKEIEEINITQYSDMLDIYRRLLVALRNKNRSINILERNWFYEIKNLKSDIVLYKQELQIMLNTIETEGVFPYFFYSFNSLIKKVFNSNLENLN